MSVALIEPFEMTATLNVVVSINSTTVMQTYKNKVSKVVILVVIFPVPAQRRYFCHFKRISDCKVFLTTNKAA